MASHNELGKEGEDMAARWLQNKGYEILHRNFSAYGYPEDSVTKKKFKNLQKAADEYLFMNPGHRWIQYDILSITLHQDKEPEYFLIEDVFL